jgi:four helix bundle protein
MSSGLEDLKILQIAETIADEIWKKVLQWDVFARDVLGGQLTRAADSIGANIAEGFGRFHYGEKLNFLYYARGSLFETKYWLNRARARDLMSTTEAQDYADRLTTLARSLNAFASNLKSQRSGGKSMRESSEPYITESPGEALEALFTDADLTRLQSTT